MVLVDTAGQGWAPPPPPQGKQKQEAAALWVQTGRDSDRDVQGVRVDISCSFSSGWEGGLCLGEA